MSQDIKNSITELKPWWEDISIQGISTKTIDNKAGRNKEQLFSNVFDKQLGKDFFSGRTVIDLGCNAGGSTVQILNRGGAFVTCVEGDDLAFRQLQLVTDVTQTMVFGWGKWEIFVEFIRNIPIQTRSMHFFCRFL